MDEWQLEMREIKDQIARLQAAKGDPVVIEELEAELRILQSLYGSATEVFDAGQKDGRLRKEFAATEMGEWSFENVYSYVYEMAMELDTGRRELASVIPEVDYVELIREAAR